MAIENLRRKYVELCGEIRGADLKGLCGLYRALPKFFQQTITVAQATEEIQGLLESREQRFLDQARCLVYENPRSPYLRLLKNAGCDFADLRDQVRRYGLERALSSLAAAGVYLTADEFKGKRPVTRGRDTFRVSPRHFECTTVSPGYFVQSSGTANAPLRTFTPLEWLIARSFSACVFFAAHDLFKSVHAVYDAVLPGAGGINQLLMYTRIGVVFDRWFARRIPLTWPEAAYFYLTTQLIVLTGRLTGPGFPKPRFIQREELDVIIDWIEANRRRGRIPCITTAASNAARIARTAWERGVSLEGTRFIVTGEPFTEAKRHVIERSGGTATLSCTYGGAMVIGSGCADRIYTDEVHVNQHLFALIDHTRTLAHNVQVQPLLCTTLDRSAPRFLFNVESGDYAVIERRDCQCRLGTSGLSLHLHRMRSFEKFTSEGVNYFVTDLFEVLETTLPTEFGGEPGDYQIIEEEDANGQNVLALLVDPQVPNLDEKRLLSRLVEILMRDTPGNRVMTKLWESIGTLKIRRAIPHASARGKVLPLHLAQRRGP